MNVIPPELERQVLHPVMHQKIPLRAAELVEQGWTRGTAARDADGQKVRSMAPRAIGWCVVGAVDRGPLRVAEPRCLRPAGPGCRRV